MCKHERAVGEVEHVELDQVDAELDGPPERPERVLGLERGGSLVADDERQPVAATEVHYRRRTTTTAQSSASSPPLNARQSSTIPRASCWAVRPRFAAANASSRSVP